jgi:hypothetical protein
MSVYHYSKFYLIQSRDYVEDSKKIKKSRNEHENFNLNM